MDNTIRKSLMISCWVLKKERRCVLNSINTNLDLLIKTTQIFWRKT